MLVCTKSPHNHLHNTANNKRYFLCCHVPMKTTSILLLWSRDMQSSKHCFVTGIWHQKSFKALGLGSTPSFMNEIDQGNSWSHQNIHTLGLGVTVEAITELGMAKPQTQTYRYSHQDILILSTRYLLWLFPLFKLLPHYCWARNYARK